MGKPLPDSDLNRKAQNALRVMKQNKTWVTMSNELEFDRGYLWRVMYGYRPASQRLITKLGLKRTYPKHPVMRVTAIRRLLQNPYLQS